MKKFKANPIINVPRWLETIIHCILFLLALLVVHYTGIGAGVELTDILNFAGSGYSTILLYVLVFYFFKLIGNHTAVDSLEIDYNNKNMKVVYWLFYFYRRELTISFEELSYKNRNDILIMGGYSLRIYQNSSFRIKLNSRNGWKNKQIDEITTELLMIKPPLKKLIKRPTWG